MFEFVTSIDIDVSTRVSRGTAMLPGDQPVLLGQSPPGAPALSNPWLIELMAQVAGPLAEAVAAEVDARPRWALLGMIRRATFDLCVGAPATLDLKATVSRLSTVSVTVETEAAHAGERCASAELVMMLFDATPTLEQARDDRALRLKRWKDAWRVS